MKIRELIGCLHTMDPEQEAFVALFKLDGTGPGLCHRGGQRERRRRPAGDLRSGTLGRKGADTREVKPQNSSLLDTHG
jgi:hypothetical protein